MLGQDVNSKFNHLVKILSSKRFLDCQILCNEVPFFIADYQIKKESEMLKLQGQLIKKLAELKVKVLNVNIYDLVVEKLKETGDWDWYIENESTISKTVEPLPVPMLKKSNCLSFLAEFRCFTAATCAFARSTTFM